jgi:polyhydroxyalkanoate synthase subunit PhaC
MARETITSEVVNNSWSVELVRELIEVQTTDGLNLLMTRKRPQGGGLRKKPLLLIHGLGQNRYTWTLSQRSFENYCVAQGYDVFNLELRGHGLSRAYGADYPMQFEDYVEKDLPAAIALVQNLTGEDRLFLCGHSLGGNVCYVVGARQPEDIAGIISVAGPVYFGREMPLMRMVAWLAVLTQDHTVLRYLRDFKLPFFVDLIGLPIRYTLFYFDHPHNHFPYSLWVPRSIERELLIERIEKGFDRTGLNVLRLLLDWVVKGAFVSSDGKTDYAAGLGSLEVPILFVVGSGDDVVPLASVEPGYELVPAADKTLIYFNAREHKTDWGHLDLLMGTLAPAVVWPYLVKWMDLR